jgi:hypothetical protein
MPEKSPLMTKEELIAQAEFVAGGQVRRMNYGELCKLMTVTQFVTDQCLNEIERRGELTYDRSSGKLVIPYQCDYALPTILTR